LSGRQLYCWGDNFIVVNQRTNASAIIVTHNHPSGDPTPSPDDVAVTRAIVQAGKLLDVDVLDHLVVGQGKWVSMKERGLGFG
jgi:DNA repair protein RadC